jgi:hypothetical protein
MLAVFPAMGNYISTKKREEFWDYTIIILVVVLDIDLGIV